MGIKESVMVNFKIGPSSFMHKCVVYEGLTRPFILGEGFLSHHCFTLGWTDDNKRFAEYRNKAIAFASQTVMDDQIMVSHPVKIPVRNVAMVPQNVQTCLQVGFRNAHAQNLKINSLIYTLNLCNVTILKANGRMSHLT